MTDKKTVFSGIQPTGNTHIGNYVGALKNWVTMQDNYDAIYCVVDMHAITIPHDPRQLASDRLAMAKTLLAVGIDPNRSLLYFQSQVPQHAELSWILSADTPLGALNRMTQYKEKADKAGEKLGLFSYPVLMAADILVHKAHAVPVGDDQTQHLELARDVAQRFNHLYGEEFPLPEQITPGVGARIMSLQEPTAKMSKSDEDAGSRILIHDEPDTIVAKLKRAVTDSGSEIAYDLKEKAGVSNLIEIMAAFSGRSIDAVVEGHATDRYGDFKLAVADAVIEGLNPVRAAYKALDDQEVRRIMADGSLSARHRAEREMVSVRTKVGLSG